MIPQTLHQQHRERAESMSNTEKDWRADWVENLKRLGCLIAIICFTAFVAGLFAPLHSRAKDAHAEKLWQKGRAAYKAKDYETAVKYYKKSAEQGNEKAQFNFALCYAKGEGVEKDLREAAKWYRKAAEQGFALAQNMLALCYDTGEGVEQDYALAAEWYRKAAEQGYADAQLNLGGCYSSGHGVGQDYTEAVKWYQKAADQDFVAAQFILGGCYESGEGVEQDYVQAAEWYRKAAEQGNELAIEALERLGAQ